MSGNLEHYITNKVVPYKFDDEEINSLLAELNRKSFATVSKCKKQIFILKGLLVLSAFLLTVLLEYMMFESLWYREPVFKVVMIFTPVLAAFIGYMIAVVIDKTFDLNYGLFNSEFQYAYDNKFIYVFKGAFHGVQSVEKHWTNIVAGEYCWRVRDKIQDFRAFENKNVLLFLTRAFYDDEFDFECVLMREAI